MCFKRGIPVAQFLMSRLLADGRFRIHAIAALAVVRVASSRSRLSLPESAFTAPPEGWSDWCAHFKAPMTTGAMIRPGRLAGHRSRRFSLREIELGNMQRAMARSARHTESVCAGRDRSRVGRATAQLRGPRTLKAWRRDATKRSTGCGTGRRCRLPVAGRGPPARHPAHAATSERSRAIGAAPVAFEALLGGEKDDLVAFLAKGLLIPSCALVTATMMADFVDVARVALYPLGVAVGEHDGSARWTERPL